MRTIQDENGRRWGAISIDTPVAHVRTGARLAFVPAEEPDTEPVLQSNVTFNSHEAAAFAIRTMSEKELLRRLSLASVNAPDALNDPDDMVAPTFGRGE